ncbi:MAG TPA: SMC family ATPase [Dehalococcoidia bacterium]|nr:SMC family ATPase [Dehalococcoidia bacterium]
MEVEGFTCYRDRQPALEFSDLTLFAIAGPTGAGKSSILDAMLYALFGEVPRIGKHGVSEFISQGRDRMSVALDFRVRSRDYRVTRASKQTKTSVKTDATLAELTVAGERSLASQVKQVNDEIVKLLGLGYDEFIQTVVLPQGEFAKFLKAKPSDQRSILQHLLRHEVFTRMRDLAEERRKKLDVELSGLHGTLSGLAHATDEALAANEARLGDARTCQADAVKARDEADQLAQDARVRRTLTEEVERLRGQRSLLEKDEARVERLREELEQSRRAITVVPHHDAFKLATSRAGSARSAHAQAISAAERATAARTTAAKHAAIASDAAKECIALSARLQRLHEIAGDVARRTQLAAALRAVAEDAASAEQALKIARDASARALQAVSSHEERALDSRAAVVESSFDEALSEAVEGASASVGTARAIQQQIASLETDLKDHQTAQYDAQQRIAAALVARDDAGAALAATEARLTKADAHAQKLQAAFDGTAFDGALLEAIEGSLASVGTAKALQAEVGSLEAEIIQRQVERTQADERAGEVREAYDGAQSSARSAGEVLIGARAALEAGRDRDRAVTLRTHLHVGDACPVCLQRVPEIPAASAEPELAALEETVAAAESRAVRAAEISGEVQATLAEATGALQLASKVVDETGSKLADRRAALDAVLSQLSAIIPDCTTADGTDVVAWIEERREALRAARAEKARREKDLQSAESVRSAERLAVAEAESTEKRAADAYQYRVEDQARLVATVADAATRLTQRREELSALLATLTAIAPSGASVKGLAVLTWLEGQRERLRTEKAQRERLAKSAQDAEALLGRARVAAAEAEGSAARAADLYQARINDRTRVQADLDATSARILSVTTHADPVAERDDVARQIAALLESERTATAKLTDATHVAVKADTECQAAESALSAAAEHASTVEASLTQALAAAGFGDVESALAFVRSDDQQGVLQTKVAAFDTQRAGVLQRLAEIEPQVTGREISAEGLADIERQTKGKADASRQADKVVATLEADISRLRADVTTRAALLAKKGILERTFAVTAELAADLKGDRFQEYLLEEAFKTLVEGASVRLKGISNRYALQWDSGEFYVVDHDNAGERRRAETLSGGETFMASLCLALQLSDEVLRTSGALQMDSLFIDEGFGTLDSDSLSEVTDAMEALRQDGDRMIGVISHRPELTDRLPGCVRVNKGTGESNWVLERIG